MKKATLYEQNPAVWDKIAEKHPSVREVAKKCLSCAEMDEALGYIKGADHWVSGRNLTTLRTERAAKAWLAGKKFSAPEPASDGVLMVITPAAKLEAVRRVLAALGCEVVDV